MKNETERLEELRVKIIQWADEKGILSKATPEKQFLKFIEETGELAKAILTSDSHEFIDAVGDVFVTIVIHAKLKDISFEHKSTRVFATENDTMIGSMVNYVLDERYEVSIETLIDIHYGNELLTEEKNFADCVEVAYNVIAGRTGEMINGSFVKDK